MGAELAERHFLPNGSAAVWGRLGEAWLHGFWQITPVLAVAGLIGVWVLLQRDRAYAGFLIVLSMAVTWFAAAYEIRDWQLYCIPAWLAVVVCSAVGLAQLLEQGHRIRAAVAGVLMLMVGFTAVSNYLDMRVDFNPHDHRWLIDEAADNGIIVPYIGGSRQAHQLGYYYRYGEGLRNAQNLEFVSVEELLETPALLFDSRPLYALNLEVASVVRRLRRSGVDLVKRPFADDPRRSYAVSGVVEPVREIVYRLDRAGALEIRLHLGDEGMTHYPSEASVFATVVSRGDWRTRGTARLSPDMDRWYNTLAQGLRVVARGDWVSVVGMQLDAEARSALLRVLTTARGPARQWTSDWTSDPAPPETEIADLIFTYQSDNRNVMPRIEELVDGLRIPIPLPREADR